MLGVNVEKEPQAARKFRDRHSLTYPVLIDGESRAYQQFRQGHFVETFLPADVVATPFNVILDRRGQVRYRDMGFSRETIRQKIEELLNTGS